MDLADFAGRDLHLRWRFATDDAVASPGWWIDDAELLRTEGCAFLPTFVDGFESGDLRFWNIPSPAP